MSAQDVSAPEGDTDVVAPDAAYVDEIDSYLEEIITPAPTPMMASRPLRPSTEENFAIEAYQAVSNLQIAIAHLHGVRDYCMESGSIRRRLTATNNDPSALASRINAHAARLGVELRSLSALFFGNQLGAVDPNAKETNS